MSSLRLCSVGGKVNGRLGYSSGSQFKVTSLRLQMKGSGIKRGTPGPKIEQLEKGVNIGPVNT